MLCEIHVCERLLIDFEEDGVFDAGFSWKRTVLKAHNEVIKIIIIPSYAIRLLASCQSILWLHGAIHWEVIETFHDDFLLHEFSALPFVHI
jgi:hypothetical protein